MINDTSKLDDVTCDNIAETAGIIACIIRTHQNLQQRTFGFRHKTREERAEVLQTVYEYLGEDNCVWHVMSTSIPVRSATENIDDIIPFTPIVVGMYTPSEDAYNLVAGSAKQGG